jgi:hypothetical protein
LASIVAPAFSPAFESAKKPREHAFNFVLPLPKLPQEHHQSGIHPEVPHRVVPRKPYRCSGKSSLHRAISLRGVVKNTNFADDGGEVEKVEVLQFFLKLPESYHGS